MCGIIASIEREGNAPRIVFDGLKHLEMRGYDSWGITYKTEYGLESAKMPGKLPDTFRLPSSTMAIGHTRWATHGGVSVENSHPHSGCNNSLSVVHNGVIENFRELKEELSSHKFTSQTDTEVIAHMVEQRLVDGDNLLEATAYTFNKLRGLNAFVLASENKLIGATNGMSLVLGKLPNGFAIASDHQALAPFTNQFYFIEDGEIVNIDDSPSIFSGKNITTPQDISYIDIEQFDKKTALEGYPHFFLKEICQQLETLLKTLENQKKFAELADMIRQKNRLYLTGCGSASYASLLGSYILSDMGFPAINLVGSEHKPIKSISKDDLLIAISQSGQTVDILDQVNIAKNNGAKVLALTNTYYSPLYRDADYPVLLNAGVEKAVVATKSMTSMVASLLILSGSIAGKEQEAIETIHKSAEEVQRVLARAGEINELAGSLLEAEHMFILGRGMSYPVALEAALKVKEASYLHAEGFAGGELKHGVMALIEKGTPVLAFVPDDEEYALSVSNTLETNARDAFLIGVGPKKIPEFNRFFEIKDSGASSVIPNLVFSQLLGYHIAVRKGLNPDMPRHLAKTVTVR